MKNKKYICLDQDEYRFLSYSLKSVQPADIETIRKWRNSQMDILRQSSTISPAQQREYFTHYIWPSMNNTQPENILLTFSLNHRKIGYGGLVHISWINKTAELSFLLNPIYMKNMTVYKKHFDAFIHLLLDIAFRSFDFNKISTETYHFRRETINILEENGFLFEKIIKSKKIIRGKEIKSFVHYHFNDRKKKMLCNILITSISNKVPLIHSVIDATRKFDSTVKVYGGDFDKDVIGKYFVDKFWKMPKLIDLPIKKLLDFCKEESIGIIIPTRDGELVYYADHKKELNKNGICVMVSGSQAVRMSLDKLKFYEDLSKKGIPVIPTSLSIDEKAQKSYVVKERFGSGSRKIGLDLGYQEALKYAKLLKNPIYQPFVKGIECSVDAYITNDGIVKGVVSRVRNLVVDGEAQITSTFIDNKLEKLAVRLIHEMKLIGHIIIQVIRDEHGRYHVIECNARFGGASTLSIVSGLDSFYWFILEANGIDISKYSFIRKENIRQIRYKKDLVISI